jgi:hypothetical protein
MFRVYGDNTTLHIVTGLSDSIPLSMATYVTGGSSDDAGTPLPLRLCSWWGRTLT